MKEKTFTTIFFVLFIIVLLVVSTMINYHISQPNCDPTKEFNETVMIQVGKTCFYRCYEIDCENDLNLTVIQTSGNFDNRPYFRYHKGWIDILNKTGGK